MRKGGVVTWFLFLLLLIEAIVVMIFVVTSASTQELGFSALSNDVTVEEEVAFKTSGSSGLQLASSIIMTDYEDQKVIDMVEEFVYCYEQPKKKNCGDNYVSDSDISDVIDYKTARYFDDENLGEHPYFMRIVKDGNEILTLSRDVSTVFRQGKTYPQFQERTTVSKTPVPVPDDSNAFIEFRFPLGGLTTSAFTRGDES